MIKTDTIDPSDRYDLDREIEVTPTDCYVPLGERYPDTTDVHPMDCTCQVCQAWNEYHDYVDDYADQHYAESRNERLAEEGFSDWNPYE